jgi:ferredoxin
MVFLCGATKRIEEMTIAEIFEKFDKIGCLTFATIDGDMPQTRIAHLFAYDDEGLYFRTMNVKAFYGQLKKTGKVSVCGMYPKTQGGFNDEGMPYFPPGYAIRATGDVKEISLDALKEKASANEMFVLGVKDTEKYPAMTTFCLYKAWGEIFDFDFEMERRSHKLLRVPFSYGGGDIPFQGVRISDRCTSCGLCGEKCSFKAISREGDRFVVDHAKCDVCGDCSIVCPAGAIDVVF